MIKSRKVRRSAVALGLAAVGAMVLPSSAQADTTSQYFADTSRRSDPFIWDCQHPQLGAGKCLISSEDEANVPGRRDVWYPMNRTLTMFSADGRTWTNSSVAIQETDLPAETQGAHHLWAPAVLRSTEGGANWNYLYVPDLTNPNDNLSSKIYVAKSTNPLSGYSSNKLGWVTGAPSAEYMSDPEVFSDSATPLTDRSKDYLVFADGDYGTCGGVSIRKMTSRTAVEPYNTVLGARVTWANKATIVNELGFCTKSNGTDTDLPYFEGPSVFKFDRFGVTLPGGATSPAPYVMLVPIKPDKVPDVCKKTGQPNTDKSVLTWATATSITGSWTYRGILMCGSTSEWTNQATITKVTGSNGKSRLVLVYHDGPAPACTPDNRGCKVTARKLHSDCLMYDGNNPRLLWPSRDGASNALANPQEQWCLKVGADINTIQVRVGGAWKYLKANTNVFSGGTDVGTYEQFSFGCSGVICTIRSRNATPVSEGVWRMDDATRKVTVNDADINDRQMQLSPGIAVPNQTGVFNIKTTDGHYLYVDTAGNVFVKNNTTAPAATDQAFWFKFGKIA